MVQFVAPNHACYLMSILIFWKVFFFLLLPNGSKFIKGVEWKAHFSLDSFTYFASAPLTTLGYPGNLLQFIAKKHHLIEVPLFIPLELKSVLPILFVSPWNWSCSSTPYILVFSPCLSLHTRVKIHRGRNFCLFL